MQARPDPPPAGHSNGVVTPCFEVTQEVALSGAGPPFAGGGLKLVVGAESGGNRPRVAGIDATLPPVYAAQLLVMHTATEAELQLLQRFKAGNVDVDHACHNKACLNRWDGHIVMAAKAENRSDNGPPSQPSRSASRTFGRAATTTTTTNSASVAGDYDPAAGGAGGDNDEESDHRAEKRRRLSLGEPSQEVDGHMAGFDVFASQTG
jgi:hypothetical protein